MIVPFSAVIKGLLKGLEDLDLEDDWRPSKQQRPCERPKYGEESWKLEETRCHSNSSERPSAKTNHIKTRIDKMQQNSKCRLCGDRDETINHIISECIKLAQKEYKIRHDWVGKVIYWEICKKFTFDQTNKLYMHNQARVLEYDTHKLLWDFDIQTDHLISARRQDLIITRVYKEIEASTKIPLFTLFEGTEFKFEIRFYSSPLVF